MNCFIGKTDLGDGYTRWDWRVHYPINSYNVSLNIGEYVKFSEPGSDPSMDYFVLPENLDQSGRQGELAGHPVRGGLDDQPNKLGRSLEVATDLFYVNVAILDADGKPTAPSQ